MKPGEGAWATSHFDPDLNVTILGMSAEEENKLKNSPSVSSSLGKWLDTSWGSVISIYPQNDIYIIETKFKDGSSSKRKAKFIKITSGRKFYSFDNSYSEYYVILNN